MHNSSPYQIIAIPMRQRMQAHSLHAMTHSQASINQTPLVHQRISIRVVTPYTHPSPHFPRHAHHLSTFGTPIYTCIYIWHTQLSLSNAPTFPALICCRKDFILRLRSYDVATLAPPTCVSIGSQLSRLPEVELELVVKSSYVAKGLCEWFMVTYAALQARRTAIIAKRLLDEVGSMKEPAPQAAASGAC